MSTRKLQQKPSHRSAQNSRQEVERLIEKRKIKDAFKHAKLCFHREASAEHRRLLERVYLLRIEELLRGNMPAAAAEIARHFLDFGVTDSELFGPLAAVLTQLGMVSESVAFQKRLQSPAEQASLAVSLADRAVLHPEQIPASMPDLLDGARQIRSALAALDADNEALAAELLHDVPRQSPWADWRYFARGLAAFRGRDWERARANWDRLAPDRPARRIAEMLRSLLPSPAGQPSQSSMRDLSRLETAVFGEPILGRIERIRRLVDTSHASAADWQDAQPHIEALRRGLGRIDPRLAQRLTEILLPAIFELNARQRQRSGERLMAGFTQVAEPLWIDPQWSRLKAMIWERTGDARDAADCWEEYAGSLDGHEKLTADERRSIQAQVLLHTGNLLAREAKGGDVFGSRRSDDELQLYRARIMAVLERSVRLDPAQRAAHERRIELYDEWDQPDLMAAAARELLQAFPDDVAALARLIDYHRKRDEAGAALEHVLHARRVKPLDAALVGEECWARLALARRMALEGRWEAGRAEFTRVRALDHEFARGFRVAARQAVFELKAGDAQRAGAFIEEAQALAPDPTGLWLALSIEATRYALPAARRREFQQEFQAALKKKTSGKAAALLAEILVAYLGAEVEYEGRDDHVEAVVSYIERSSRAKYSEAELLAACWFLQGLPAARDLFERFVRRGRKAFPESPEFLCLAAEVEMAKGPMRANLRQLRKLLDQASQRIDAMASDDPKRVASLKSHVLRMDDMVRAAADVRENLPDFSTDMLDELLRFLPDDLEMFGDDDDSDDDGFGFSSAPGARLPRPRG